MIPEATRRAWQAARYRVRADTGWINSRIDQPNAGIAGLLAEHGVESASLVTGCNPRGRRLDDTANRRRLAALREELLAAGYRCREAEGAADDGGWVEASLFVPGFAGPACAAVMRAHEQLAWVEYDAQGRSRLIESGLDAEHNEDAA